ncbi:MAG: 23S rRNA (adenine(2030)-N(6))-methyltransferase RlmJ [Hyphomicrobiaceae bacterium]|nr:23S rRNA (adenine(2030)-N(6))-methyltransferase RlmJ [Hyphomicrobiaceae bacterium]
MNYRHAYHAGNFADVLKHVVLAQVIEHLKRKPAPFRVIDTHAGLGVYDLGGPEAGKTGEWQDGIGRIWQSDPPGRLADILEPYIGVISRLNAQGSLRLYPGSPLIAHALMRSNDVLIANELHPADRATLEETLGGAGNAKVLGLDAWVAVKSLLPPKERRGLILVDPPFEEPDELGRIIAGLANAGRRFATGVYMVWYPIKDLPPIMAFHARLAGLGLEKVVAVDLVVDRPSATDRLNGCGIVIVNPPFGLLPHLMDALPWLTARLARSADAHFRLQSLGAETLPTA